MGIIVAAAIICLVLFLIWKVMGNTVVRRLLIAADCLLIAGMLLWLGADYSAGKLAALIILIVILIWFLVMKDSKQRIEQKSDRELDKRQKKRTKKNELLSFGLILLLSGIISVNSRAADFADYPYADGLNEFTESEIETLRNSFNIPDNIQVTGISCSDPYYWEAAGVWVMSVSLYSGDQMLAGASVAPETLAHMRNIYMYSDGNVNLSKVVYKEQTSSSTAMELSDTQRLDALEPMVRAYMNDTHLSREAGEKDLSVYAGDKDAFWSLIYIYAIYDDSRSSSGGKRTYYTGEVSDIAYAMLPDFNGTLPAYPDRYYSGNGAVILGSDSITFYLASPEEQRFSLDTYSHLEDGGLEIRYLQEWAPYTMSASAREDSYYVVVRTKPYRGGSAAAYRFNDTIASIRYERGGTSGTGTQYQSTSGNNSAGDYVLPGSDSRYISSSELSGMDAATLRLARNEIYARHGRLFNAADLQSYFNGKTWYSGTISPDAFSESVFNTYEKENLKQILNAEDALK